MKSYNFYRVNGTMPADLIASTAQLVEKIVASKQSVMIVARQSILQGLSSTLWSEPKTSFNVHGFAGEAYAESQPILLSEALTEEAANKANIVLILGEQGEEVPVGQLKTYDKVCDLFLDDPAYVAPARVRWKALAGSEVEKAFYQQTEQGWKKAA